MQSLKISIFTSFGLLSAACADNAAETTSDRAVDAAYAALVSDVASCAKQVKTCVDAADGGESARASCRDEFASCREAAGKPHVDALASAVRSCTSLHNACVKTAKHTEAGSCQDELRSCLGAAHASMASMRDDEDAGTDDRMAARADCLDELHPCVQAAGPANACAEQVRMCLVDSMPGADAVVPESDSEDTPTDADSGKGNASTHGKGQSQGKAKDVSPARMCVDTFHSCVDAGSAARSCAQSLKACRASATP